MDILEHHEHRSPLGEASRLPEKGLEGPEFLRLRRQVQGRVARACRNQQQRRDQWRDLGEVVGRLSK
jgi:hypothetical protein